MVKNELIAAVAKEMGMTQKEAGEVIETTFRIITKTLERKGFVKIAKFGLFETRRRAGRVGCNPQDPAKKIDIPARTVPVFKPSKSLKEKVQ